jgi:hypothetical protein
VGRRRKIGFSLLGLFCGAAAAAAGLSNGVLIGYKVEIHPRHEVRAGRAWLANDTIAICRYLSLSGTAEVRIPADGVARPCKLVGPAA